MEFLNVYNDELNLPDEYKPVLTIEQLLELQPGAIVLLLVNNTDIYLGKQFRAFVYAEILKIDGQQIECIVYNQISNMSPIGNYIIQQENKRLRSTFYVTYHATVTYENILRLSNHLPFNYNRSIPLNVIKELMQQPATKQQKLPF